jgi:hypothetical protein
MRKAYAHWTLPSSAAAALALAVLIILRDQGELTATFLSWMLIPVYACHQIEEHAWPGGFQQYVNAHAFGVTDRAWPLDHAAVFWNPGVVTGLLLLVPVGIAGYAVMAHLSTADAVGAWAIGVAVHLGLVGFGVVRLPRSRVSPQSSPA